MEEIWMSLLLASRIQPLSVIRSPLNRIEIPQAIQGLHIGSSKAFRRLKFFLELPNTDIAKTIIYIDRKNAALNARRYLVNRLIDLGYQAVHAKDTTWKCDADVCLTDQQRIYAEYKQPDSVSCAMLATSC
jgi:hypothetical protein